MCSLTRVPRLDGETVGEINVDCPIDYTNNHLCSEFERQLKLNYLERFKRNEKKKKGRMNYGCI